MKKKVSVVALIVVFALLVGGWSFFAVVELNSVRQAFRLQNDVPKIIAHRGAAAHYFENTIEAFEYAVNCSYFQGIETDVRITADGVFVVSHDDNPFLDKSVLISKSNYGDIKELPLDTGAKGEFVPELPYRLCTYEDYLKIARLKGKIALIELKATFSEAQLSALSELTRDWLSVGRVVFCGFDRTQVEAIGRLNPAYRLMVFAKTADKAFMLNRYGYNIGFNQELLKKKSEYVEKLQKSNRYAGVYTVNDRDEIIYYQNLNVDFIITDYNFSEDIWEKEKK